MFHLYITLAYIIPNIYIFFRIKGLFINKDYRLLYIFIYLLIGLIYPIAEGYSHRDMNVPMQVLSTVSGYILPFFLYLFLAVVIFDLFLLFNMLVRIVSSETRKSYLFRFFTLSVMIILSITVVVAGSINLNTIRVSKYRVDVPGKQGTTIDHLKIAFVADFHIQQNTNLHFVEQFVRKIDELQPDIMLYGGDITEGHRENEITGTIESVIRNIQ